MLSHGGNIYYYSRKYRIPPEDIIDFSASVNPLGVPESALRAIQDSLPLLVNYPDPDMDELKEAIAASTGIGTGSILAGNGSTELIYLLPRFFRPKNALVFAPTFSDYARALKISGCRTRCFNLREEEGFVPDMKRLERAASGVDLVFLCNPNNPTGVLVDREPLLRMAEALLMAGKKVIVDEAFIEYTPGGSIAGEAARMPGLIVLRNFTKFYGMPGLRLGYLAAHPSVVKKLEMAREPWSVNTLAVKAAVAAISDRAFAEKSLRVFREEREFLSKALMKMDGLKVFSASANFFLVKLDGDADSDALAERMAEKGVLIRSCSNFKGLGGRFIRLAVRARPENERLIAALRDSFLGG